MHLFSEIWKCLELAHVSDMVKRLAGKFVSLWKELSYLSNAIAEF